MYNIYLKVTGAGKDSCVPDNATAIDLDVMIDRKLACCVTVAADPHDQRPIMYGADEEYWCSNPSHLATLYTERAEGMVKYPDDAEEVYMAAIKLAESDIMIALGELLDTNDAPMYWSGGFWTGE